MIKLAFLRFLENLRNPFLDAFFSLITLFGEETVFILLGILFFWCVNKKQGYYLLSVGFIGIVINQFLKLCFRIERPWVKDKNFTIVEPAREAATGYSFPSGHTQSSVGIFGGIARWNKNKVLRILLVALCVLVPVSRLYLGVHTPLDVGVSVIIALILIFVIYPIIYKGFENKKVMRSLLLFMTVITVVFLLYVNLFNFPKDIDGENLQEGIKNAYKMLGCTLGIWFSYELDSKFIKFDTKAPFFAQILKLVLGLIPLFAIKAGLKSPLYALFGGSYFADFIRYLLLVLFAGCIWPLTFKFFSKIGNRE